MSPAEVRQRERAQHATDQPADVAADRDTRHGDREDDVDDDDRQRASPEDVHALPLEYERGSEDPEDRARGADRRGIRRREQRPGRSSKARDDVDEQEARTAQEHLDRCAEPPQREHVEDQVEDVRVQERRGDQSPPVPVGHERAEEQPLREDLPTGVVDPRALYDGDDVNEHVDRDQHLGHVGISHGRSDRARGRARHLRGLGAIRRVLRAAQADRRGGHAFGADRTSAFRAGKARLAVRMAIAVHVGIA
jgi:hypothetical protein